MLVLPWSGSLQKHSAMTVERPPAAEILATVSRSGSLESWHQGSLVVVQGEKVLLALGDADELVFCRSSTKALQALPLLERGVTERLGFTDQELTLMCASHNGSPEHTRVAASILTKGGFEDDDLLCGPHAPFGKPDRQALLANGVMPNKLHNNCSGKHAGFLLLAKDMGVAKEDYLHADSESQQLIRATVAEMAGLQASDVGLGVDGCGAPTMRMPLVSLARSFCRMTNPKGLAPVRQQACETLLNAVAKEPVLLAGKGRLCTSLVQSAPGRVFPKNGAEGVYALGLPGRNIGVAVKVLDGQDRGYFPVIVSLLDSLGLWQGGVPQSLSDFQEPPIHNTQGLQLGRVHCPIAWPLHWPASPEGS